MSRILLLILLAIPATGEAHDYWLELSPWRSPQPSIIVPTVVFGEALRPDGEASRDLSRVTRLDVLSPVSAAFRSHLDQEIFGPIDAPAAGLYVILMERAFASVELEWSTFRDYLAEEGHSTALDLLSRERRDASVHERFARTIKGFARVGDGSAPDPGHVFGAALEIVPDVDPTLLRPGDELPVRVLRGGAPVSGMRLDLASRTGETVSTRSSGITDSDGRATFVIGQSGVQIVRGTVIRRCEPLCDGHEWESLWTAMTFAVEPAN